MRYSGVMKYPLALLLPFFLLLDVLADVYVARRAAAAYDGYFSYLPHQVPPGWTSWKYANTRDKVLRIGWRLFVTALLIGVLESDFYAGSVPRVHLGIAIGASGLWAARHLNAWATVKYVTDNPGDVRGHIAISTAFAAVMAGQHYLGVASALAVAAMITSDPFMWGFAIGAFALFVGSRIGAGDLKDAEAQFVDPANVTEQRQQAVEQGRPWCELLELTDMPDMEASFVRVETSQDTTTLTFHTAPDEAATVEFTGSRAATLAPPNDETIENHRLWGSGLERHQAHIVHNSDWIAATEEQGRIDPDHDPDAWTNLTHFVFTFHVATFECIAESFVAEPANAEEPKVEDPKMQTMSAAAMPEGSETPDEGR